MALSNRCFGEGKPHTSGATVRKVAHVVQVLMRRTRRDQNAGYITPPRVVAQLSHESSFSGPALSAMLQDTGKKPKTVRAPTPWCGK